MVKDRVETEEDRKKLYRELLHLGLGKNEIPSSDEIEKILYKYT